MKKLYHLFLTFALLSAAGCNDFLDPDDDNSYKGDELLTYIQEGVLLNAYASVPNANQISVMTDVATDNAVWNTSSGNAFRNIVSGEWSSTNNPFDKWSSAYTAIGYCNLFLDELVDRVEWSYSDAWLCEAFRERLTAEARGLRAYYYMELLTAHSGVGVNTGRLLGVPCTRSTSRRAISIFRATRMNAAWRSCSKICNSPSIISPTSTKTTARNPKRIGSTERASPIACAVASPWR